jgi:hypothetical protein
VNIGVDLSSYVGQTIYVEFAYSHASSGFEGDMSIDLMEVSSCIACAIPSNLAASNAGPTTVDLGWTENGTATAWEISYGAPGFTAGSGTQVIANSNPFTLTGLSNATAYDVYVRSVCGAGDTSLYSSVESFVTTCPAITPVALPYIEGFESNSGTVSGGGFLFCATDASYLLTTSDPSGRARYGTNAVLAASGSGALTLDRDPSGGNQINWVDITLDMSAFAANTDLELIFDFAHHGEESHPNDRVWVRGSDTSAWVQIYDWYANRPATGTYVNSGPLDIDAAISGAGQTITSSFQIRFGQEDNFPATSPTVSDGFSVDNIIVRQTPTCLSPIALNTVNITATTATGVWSPRGPGSSFEVELGAAGFVQGTGTIVSTTDTFVNVSSLTANTTYDWYVREICAPGDTSFWSGPAQFTTACDVYAAPFFENFDNTLAWSVISPFNIDQCWSRNPNTGLIWRTEDGPTSSTNTGPNTDLSGSGQYVYMETSSGSQGDTSILVTPDIDISTLTTPEARFFYYMFGADVASVELQVNDGGNWVTIWSQSGQQQTSGSDPWLETTALIPPTASDTIQLRFLGIRGSGFAGDIAIDEFEVRESPADDMKILSVTMPTAGCGLTANETVTVSLQNVGSAAQSNIDVAFDVAGGNSASEVIAGPVNSGDTVTYTFSTAANLSAIGVFNVAVYSDLATDQNRANDTLNVTVANSPVISSFPYTEDFESGAGGWVAGGANSTWELGMPAGAVIDTAASGMNAWMTNLDGSYNNSENSYVESPCFDFSASVNPQLGLNIFRNAENSWDGAAVQASFDGGITWVKIGAFGDTVNWYNDNTISGLAFTGDQDGWTGTTDTTWSAASRAIDSATGQLTKLRIAFGSDGSVNGFDGFAFDDISITIPSIDNDLGVVAINSIAAACDLSASEAITIDIVNAGTLDQSSFSVSYTVNGGTPVTESITSILLAGDTTSYTFTQGADLSATGIYDIVAYVTLGGDANAFNDTIMTMTENLGTTPQGGFTFNETTPGNVVFTEALSPAPDSIFWDFGDGSGTSTSSNPVYQYVANGSYTVCLTAYSGNCDTTICNTVNISTIALEGALNDYVSLFPNPTEGEVMIEVSGQKFNAVEVLDMLGNVVYREDATFETQKVLNIGHLSSGNYIIRMISEDGLAIKRVMLNK